MKKCIKLVIISKNKPRTLHVMSFSKLSMRQKYPVWKTWRRNPCHRIYCLQDLQTWVHVCFIYETTVQNSMKFGTLMLHWKLSG